MEWNEVLSLVSILISILTAVISYLWSKKTTRSQYYQNLLDGFYSHNWKFIEHWDNEGIRPRLDTTLNIESHKQDFGQRVVVFDHIYILWKVYCHKDVLSIYDLESNKHWAQKWFEGSSIHLENIFTDGDMFPLDFIDWLNLYIFDQKLEMLFGDKLTERMTKWRKTRNGKKSFRTNSRR